MASSIREVLGPTEAVSPIPCLGLNPKNFPKDGFIGALGARNNRAQANRSGREENDAARHDSDYIEIARIC